MGSIAIVGLREDDGGLPDPARARVRQAAAVVAPTLDGAAARLARLEGASVTSWEELGVAAGASADVLAAAVAALAEDGDVVVLSPGFPLVRPGVVPGLLSRATGTVEALPVASPLDVLLLAFDGDLTADVDILDVRGSSDWRPTRGSHVVATGVESAALAHDLAERLREVYAPEHPVVVAERGQDDVFALEEVPLATLAGRDWASTERVVYVSPSQPERADDFYELVRIMSILRNPEGGCPWDLAQDHMTIRGNMIEEAYEAVAAIEEGDDLALADELGDILLQIVFHAQMGAEDGTFSIDDAVARIVRKLRRRHPHIFGTAEAGTPGEVLHQWEAIKRTEKPGESVLASIPHALPALLRAQKISRKAAATGFDWETVDDVWVKVHEEIDELKATEPGTPEAVDEVGDVLFSVVNVARKLHVDSETALRVTCDRFSKRFMYMEAAAAASGRKVEDLDMETMERLWAEAKSVEREQASLDVGASSRPPDGGS